MAMVLVEAMVGGWVGLAKLNGCVAVWWWCVCVCVCGMCGSAVQCSVVWCGVVWCGGMASSKVRHASKLFANFQERPGKN